MAFTLFMIIRLKNQIPEFKDASICLAIKIDICLGKKTLKLSKYT